MRVHFVNFNTTGINDLNILMDKFAQDGKDVQSVQKIPDTTTVAIFYEMKETKKSKE